MMPDSGDKPAKRKSAATNSSLDGNTRRAIDVREGETVDENALKALVRAAVKLNVSRTQSRSS